MIYTKSDQTWTDEGGTTIPFNRVTALERKKESISHKLLTKAEALNNQLTEFHEYMRKVCQEIFEQAMKEADADATKSKGNFTWYSFDRSIKVETNINERIDFDDATIEAAKQKLNEYLKSKLNDKEEALRALIYSAFETSRGKLDAKKVLGLLKHKSRIKAERFQEAMELIEKAIRRPDSKTYYRVSERQPDGSYQTVNLNFSAISS